MKTFVKIFASLFLTFFLTTSLSASNISLNLGFQNPAYGNQFGANLMHSWSNFAYEFGVSLFSYTNEEFTSATKDNLYGTLNIKYIFDGGKGRVFIQAGHNFTYFEKDEANNQDSDFEFTDWYGGLGILVGDLSSVYGYAALNYGEAEVFISSIGVGVCLF